MDPTGPSQPNLDQAYETPGNPVDKEPAEQQASAANATTNSAATTDKREPGDISIPSTHTQAPTPSSLGYGARDSSGDTADVRSPPPLKNQAP